MIGDWVMYNPNVFNEDEYEPTKECFPTKIYSGEDIDLAIEGCYTPIPLTPENLEKNGFESVENIFGLKTYKLNNGFILEDRGDRKCLCRSCHKMQPSSTFWICDIEYVHELQQAMRLCKINRNIELWTFGK